MHAITGLVLIWNIKYQTDIWVIYQFVRMIQPFHSGLVANVVSVSATPSGKSQLGRLLLYLSLIRLYAATHAAMYCSRILKPLPTSLENVNVIW